MDTINSEEYFVVRDKHGDDYLCPINAVKDRDEITEDEMNYCIEKDIVERYSGNIDIEGS